MRLLLPRLPSMTLALLAAAAALSAASSSSRASYSNPVLAVDFPDPAVLRLPDGSFAAYATGSGASNSSGGPWSSKGMRCT